MTKVAAMMRGDVLVVVLLALSFPLTVQADRLASNANREIARRPLSAASPAADFGAARPSADARRVADWIAATNDHKRTTFVIIDKRSAMLYVFDAQARLVAKSPVLLGAALGDENVPGIGERPIALVRPEERTTPAGRFVAERGRNARGEDVVWVDYDAAVSMHRVVTSNPAERRLARLVSPNAGDNRISYGCINVPVAFYESHIRPVFARYSGLVYILPDVASIEQVFGEVVNQKATVLAGPWDVARDDALVCPEVRCRTDSTAADNLRSPHS
jgi:hypothetical protein